MAIKQFLKAASLFTPLLLLPLAGCDRQLTEVEAAGGPLLHDDPRDPGGSHFRYATLNWSPTGAAGEVQFRLKAAFRREAFHKDWGRCIGTCTDGLPVQGDIIVENQGPTRFSFGDGGVTPVLRFRVVSVDTSDPDNRNNHWVLGEALDPSTGLAGIRHTYAAAGPYTARLAYTATNPACCRIGQIAGTFMGLNNRPYSEYPIETLVSPNTGNSSPVTDQTPVVFVNEGGATSFRISASDPDRDQIRFRMSTDAEAGGASHPSGMSIDPSTGWVTWNNQGLSKTGYWTAQVVIEDLDASGNVKSKTPVDFLLRIIEGTAPTASGSTPPNGTSFQTTSGNTISFGVGFSAGTSLAALGSFPPSLALARVVSLRKAGSLKAGALTPAAALLTPAAVFASMVTSTDPSQMLTLNHTGLPAGATFTSSPPGSTVQGTFSWTPTAADYGTYVVTFFATDGRGISSLPVSYIINVGMSIQIPDAISLNNARDRLIPVSILTTSAFNAADLVVSTITLGDEVGNDTPVATRKNGTAMASLEDVNADGRADLVLHFSQSELKANGDVTASTRELVLRGTRQDSRRIRAMGTVRIVP